MNIQALHDAIASVCPIVGVSIGDPSDKTTWRVDYDDGATTDQQAAANQIVATWVDPIPVPRITSKQFVYALNHIGYRTQWDAAYPSFKQDDRDWLAFGDNPFPIDHKRILRMMVGAGIDAAKATAQAVTE